MCSQNSGVITQVQPLLFMEGDALRLSYVLNYVIDTVALLLCLPEAEYVGHDHEQS
jgi:hypothetical protein